MMKKLSLIVFLIILAGAGIAHKFYTSITELNYDRETRTAEVMIHVDASDLEKGVAAFHQKKLKIESTAFDSLAFIYITDKFRIETAKKQLKDIHPVGIEYKKDHATIYFEIPLPEGLKHYMLTNKLFTELFTRQTNIVTVTSGDNKSSMIFNKETETRELVFD